MRAKQYLVAGLLCILLACMGVTGLVLYEYSQVTKEQCALITCYPTSETKPSYEYLQSVTVVVEATEEIKTSKEIENAPIHVQRFMGTGVIVKITKNSTYILTCRHMAGEGKKIYIINDETQDTIPADIIKTSEGEADLLLVKIHNILQNKRQIIGLGFVHPQDRCYIVGHPSGQKYAYGEGVFSQEYKNYSYIQVPTFFGSSGSGVFNSKGELVSILFAFGFQYKDATPIGDATRGKGATSLQVKDFLIGLGNEK